MSAERTNRMKYAIAKCFYSHQFYLMSIAAIVFINSFSNHNAWAATFDTKADVNFQSNIAGILSGGVPENFEDGRPANSNGNYSVDQGYSLGAKGHGDATANASAAAFQYGLNATAMATAHAELTSSPNQVYLYATGTGNATVSENYLTAGYRNVIVKYNGSSETVFSVAGTRLTGTNTLSVDLDEASTIRVSVSTQARAHVEANSYTARSHDDATSTQYGSIFVALGDAIPGDEDHAIQIGGEGAEKVHVVGGVDIANDTTGSYLVSYPLDAADSIGVTKYLYADIQVEPQHAAMQIQSTKNIGSLTIPVTDLNQGDSYYIEYNSLLHPVTPGESIDFPDGVHSFTISSGMATPSSRFASEAALSKSYLPTTLSLGLKFGTEGQVVLVSNYVVPELPSPALLGICLLSFGGWGILKKNKVRLPNS